MSDLTGRNVYEGEFRGGDGRDIGLWVVGDQKYLELYIGGHQILDMPDVAEGWQRLIRDIEGIKNLLSEAQRAIADRAIEKS